MAEALYLSGTAYNGTTYAVPLSGRDLLQEGFGDLKVKGRATFTTTGATCTISPRVGLSSKVISVLLTAGGADLGLSYAVNSTTGVVTITRSTTNVSGMEFSFEIVYG